MWTVLVTMCCYIWCRNLRRRDTNFGLFCLCTAVTLKLMMSEMRKKNDKTERLILKLILSHLLLNRYLMMPVSRCLSPNMKSKRLEWPSRNFWSWNTRLASLWKKIESRRQMLAGLRIRQP